MKKQTGFTLIEIMIALVLGLIVVGGAITIYITTIKGSSDTIKSARLNYDVDSVMVLMINDIRRAGYWGGAIAGSDATENPYTVTSLPAAPPTNFALTDINVYAYDGHANGCVLYTYDANDDGHYDDDLSDGTNSIDDRDEFYGFRFATRDDIGVIEMRQSGISTDDTDCNADPDDDTGVWQAITVADGNETVDITGLTFSLTTSKCLNVSQGDLCSAATPASGDKVAVSRELVITLTARLGTDSAVTRTLRESVKLRNDRLYKE